MNQSLNFNAHSMHAMQLVCVEGIWSYSVAVLLSVGNLRNDFFCVDDRSGLGRVRCCSPQNKTIKQNKISCYEVYAGVFEHLFRLFFLS